MAETLSMISIIAFVLAGICLVVTLILFIYFKIPSIIGDLSGKTARKSIEQMRQNNEKTGKKSYKTSKVNEKRGKLTDSINETSKTVQKPKKNEDERPETGLLDENKIRNLKKNETESLNGNESFDAGLDENETVPLDVYQNSHKTKSGGVPIQILEEVILTESEEVVR